jgi:NAD+ synthase (glutamine-hydrolysing)
MDRLGRPRSDILAFTMPGFATGETTKGYATRLAKALGVTFEELDIRRPRGRCSRPRPPVRRRRAGLRRHVRERAGRLRTDYLFRLANHRGGIVLGTGDLSELALGWCTYGVGDQMSHYTVNSGVPKTLIQHLIRWVIERPGGDDRRRGQPDAPGDPRSRRSPPS